MQPSSTSIHYRAEVATRFGGNDMYEMILLDFCSALKADAQLQPFFGGFDLTSLVDFQRETLDWVFGEYESSEGRYQELGRLQLHYFRMIENGLAGKHGRIVIGHFLFALLGAWIDENATQEIAKELQVLSSIYGEMGHDLDNSKMSMDSSLASSSPMASITLPRKKKAGDVLSRSTRTRIADALRSLPGFRRSQRS